jgi:hypothetical protein
VPHLLSEDEILQAFRQFYQCTNPGGLCLVSVRDYAKMEHLDGLKMVPRTVRAIQGGQVMMVEVWNFTGDQSEITTYEIDDQGGREATTRVFHGGRYYCVEIGTLEKLFLKVGFREVTILRERFFQPLLVALK